MKLLFERTRLTSFAFTAPRPVADYKYILLTIPRNIKCSCNICAKEDTFLLLFVIRINFSNNFYCIFYAFAL